MPNIRSIDMLIIDDVFEMNSGYVLDFSDRTFARFLSEELNINIDDPIYAKNGTSKAKRLRCLLQTVDPPTIVNVLNALWDYREVVRKRARREDTLIDARGQLMTVINRLTAGVKGPAKAGAPSIPVIGPEVYARFLVELKQLADLEVHERGYAFEAFLRRLFNAFHLDARDPFRNQGEQIDGSFVLGNETYLLEAKWENAPTGVDDLHTFHGKVAEKATWARGLFISYTGFSQGGLVAFGRGKRVICMDGLDLAEALMRRIPLNKVLDEKVRRAAETGLALVRVSDLF